MSVAVSDGGAAGGLEPPGEHACSSSCSQPPSAWAARPPGLQAQNLFAMLGDDAEDVDVAALAAKQPAAKAATKEEAKPGELQLGAEEWGPAGRDTRPCSSRC